MNEKTDWDLGFDIGFIRGFTAGQQASSQSSDNQYQEFFSRGFSDGWSYNDFEKTQCREMNAGLIASAALAEVIHEAIETQKPLSVIVLGDGEALTLAQEKVLALEAIRWRGSFLAYAGVEVPDLDARDQLAATIGNASYVGLTNAIGANYQPLLLRALQSHGIDFRKLKGCSAFFNYELFQTGALQEVLLCTNPKPRVLLIGNRAAELRQVLESTGLTLVDPVAAVKGVRDVDRVMTEVGCRHFDVALVSAGVATSDICVRIAGQFGKVALKFGHLADELISGNVKW
jgi:hypothetical protein